MAWRLASALDVLRAEINAAYPNRSTISDGTIGDAAHQSQGSASDHNPWITVGGGVGVVSALDITTRTSDDPGDELAELIRRDPRTKYVIRNGLIAYGQGSWLQYYGSDPHDTHMHVSVWSDAEDYDDTAPWGITGAASVGGALSEEDDMTPDQDARLGRVEKAAGDTWGKLLDVQSSVDTEVRPGIAFVQAQVGALTEIVGKLLAAQPGSTVDQAALIAAAEKGARNALADLTLKSA